MIYSETLARISNVVSSKGMEALNQRMVDLNHPYLLMLNSAPYQGGYRAGAPELSSLSLIVQSFFDTKPGKPAKLLADLSSAGSSALLFSANTPGAFLSSTASALASNEDEGDQYTLSSSALCSLGSSANNDPASAQTVAHSFALDPQIAQASLLPSLMANRHAARVERPAAPAIEVTNGQIRAGSTIAKAFRYAGPDTQIVDPNGTAYELRHDSPFLQLHVNQGGPSLAQLSPLERVRAIRADFLKLCTLLNSPSDHDLNPDQMNLVRSLNEAPLIGISHLVRLVASRDVPTWGIDKLPLAMRWFYTADSRLVSRVFGGTRRITPEDIRMMFLTVEQRQRICA